MRHAALALSLAAALAVPAATLGADPSPTTGGWTVAELPPVIGTDADVRGVAAGPDGLVAIGGRIASGSGDGAIQVTAELWTSPDGLAWTPADPDGSGVELGWFRPVTSGPEVGLVAITHGPAGFVLMGRIAPARFAAQQVALWRSEDGVTWQAEPTDAFPRGSRPVTLVGTPTGYLAGGVVYGSRAPHAGIWVSADGRRWTRATAGEGFFIGGYIDTMEDPASGGIRAIAPYAEGAIATGLACFPALDAGSRFAWAGRCWGTAWRSDDRRTWSGSDAPQTNGGIGHVATLGTRIVAAAEVCSGCPPAILVSDDGRSWTFAYGSPVGGELVGLLAVDDGFRALLRAEDGTLAVWASADGSDWVPMAPLPALPGGAVAIRDAAMTAFRDRLVIVVATEDDGLRSFAIVGPAAG